ncbi:MAG: hypothetical protein LBT62_01640 [Deltaproteobacteria bacterium]|jgi:hypothetical protein|nr:hypothetical protein [Deltaproteobacteria bacterium]
MDRLVAAAVSILPTNLNALSQLTQENASLDLMAVLNWKAKRQLSENPNAGAESLTKAGEELLQAGFLADSLDFFQKASNNDMLRQILKLAVEQGDFFLYTKARSALKVEPELDDLKSLADNASQSGLFLHKSKAEALIEELSLKTAK